MRKTSQAIVKLLVLSFSRVNITADRRTALQPSQLAQLRQGIRSSGTVMVDI